MCVSIYFYSLHFCTVGKESLWEGQPRRGGGDGLGETETEEEESVVVVALCEELEKYQKKWGVFEDLGRGLGGKKTRRQ
jgi:hypothetical protein